MFNHFGGSNAGDNILHRVGCRSLARAREHGAETSVEKVCSDSWIEIVKEIDRLRGGAWNQCANRAG